LVFLLIFLAYFSPFSSLLSQQKYGYPNDPYIQHKTCLLGYICHSVLFKMNQWFDCKNS
jgi:hypothetical protein